MLFDRTIEGLSAAAYYLGLRHEVIANNIANVDTPGYKALDISFKDQLKDSMKTTVSKEQRAKSEGLDARNSIPRAVSLAPPTLVQLSGDSQRPRIDRNTVDIDRELVKLSQNTILHNTYLQLLNSKFRILKSAISGNV